MKFYYIEEAVRTDETGEEYPQILKMSEKAKYSDDNSVYAFSRLAMPQNNPILKYLMLERKSKLTDVLSAVMLRLRGFLVNERFRLVLTRHNLPEHRFYDAYVKDYLGHVHEYWWLQMLVSDLEYIDFKKSRFELTTTAIVDRTFSPIDINSHTEYLKIESGLSNDERIKLSNVNLNDSFLEKPLDMFKINSLSLGWIISERLRNDILTNQITGVRITEAENVGVER